MQPRTTQRRPNGLVAEIVPDGENSGAIEKCPDYRHARNPDVVLELALLGCYRGGKGEASLMHQFFDGFNQKSCHQHLAVLASWLPNALEFGDAADFLGHALFYSNSPARSRPPY